MSDELIVLVNEQDEPTGTGVRKEMRAHRLIHRVTCVFVLNSRGDIFVQKRSAAKDYCPSHFDPGAGGVVGARDGTLLESAQREVEEELGVPATTPLTPLGKIYCEDARVRCWCYLFECVFDGPITFNDGEVVSGEFVPREQIHGHMGANRYTPDGEACLRHYLRLKGISE